jgi:ABC-type branched-subunit amino acid transport system permease subunit
MPALILTVVGIVLSFVLPPEFRQGLMYSLIGVVICLALVLIIGYVGQVSLMHTALAGVAAFAVQKLTAQAGLGFPLSPILAVGVAVIFGLVTAVPSLRLRGITLAMGTLAAAVAIEQFGFDNTTFGQNASGSIVPAPRIFGLSLGPGAHFPGWDGKLPSQVPLLACLITTVVVAMLLGGMRRSTFGQQLLAVRSNESAAAATGVNVRNTKIVAFAISAGIAGIAGVMTAYSLGSVNASEFDLSIGLSFVAFAYIGGVTTIAGAVMAGTLFPSGITGVALQNWTGLGINWLNFIGGLLLLYNIVCFPQGLALTGRKQLDWVLARVRRTPRPGADHTASEDIELVS